jgi:cation-transporting ATPase 13A3/4/5
MALVSVIGFLSLLPQLLSQGLDTSKIVDKSLDLITIAVPPALPATMSVGVSFAIQRLRKS